MQGTSGQALSHSIEELICSVNSPEHRAVPPREPPLPQCLRRYFRRHLRDARDSAVEQGRQRMAFGSGQDEPPDSRDGMDEAELFCEIDSESEHFVGEEQAAATRESTVSHNFRLSTTSTGRASISRVSFQKPPVDTVNIKRVSFHSLKHHGADRDKDRGSFQSFEEREGRPEINAPCDRNMFMSFDGKMNDDDTLRERKNDTLTAPDLSPRGDAQLNFRRVLDQVKRLVVTHPDVDDIKDEQGVEDRRSGSDPCPVAPPAECRPPRRGISRENLDQPYPATRPLPTLHPITRSAPSQDPAWKKHKEVPIAPREPQLSVSRPRRISDAKKPVVIGARSLLRNREESGAISSSLDCSGRESAGRESAGRESAEQPEPEPSKEPWDDIDVLRDAPSSEKEIRFCDDTSLHSGLECVFLETSANSFRQL